MELKNLNRIEEPSASTEVPEKQESTLLPEFAEETQEKRNSDLTDILPDYAEDATGESGFLFDSDSLPSAAELAFDKGNLSTTDHKGEDRSEAEKTDEPETEREKPQPKKDVSEDRMEPPIVITFRCPEGVDRKEFLRQLKGQERGLNSQSVSENIANRERYAQEGRAPEGAEAQRIAREKAEASRIKTNLKKGMSVEDARNEAKEWMKTQAALHNPDQIAGGNPENVSRMGDSRVNSSIGGQWRSNVSKLEAGVNNYADGKSEDALAHTKMNVRLVLED